MTHLEEKVKAAEDRIKELQLLIEYWKKEGNK
jgi:FtsZ-binding cell division protein ZapB